MTAVTSNKWLTGSNSRDLGRLNANRTCLCLFVFLALTKDVDLTISNFLDGRTTFDAAAAADADDSNATKVITSKDKITSSLPVCLSISLSVLVVVVVMISPSGSAYIGRQVPRRDEEFHHIHVVLKYIFDVNAVTEVTLTFLPIYSLNTVNL